MHASTHAGICVYLLLYTSYRSRYAGAVCVYVYIYHMHKLQVCVCVFVSKTQKTLNNCLLFWLVGPGHYPFHSMTTTRFGCQIVWVFFREARSSAKDWRCAGMAGRRAFDAILMAHTHVHRNTKPPKMLQPNEFENSSQEHGSM